MDDQAREQLCELIAARGQTLFRLPQMLETLLRQHCSDYPLELRALLTALEQGIIRDLQGLPDDADWDEACSRLAKKLSRSLPAADAEWAVDAWAEALFGDQPAVQAAVAREAGHGEEAKAAAVDAAVPEQLRRHGVLVAFAGAGGALIDVLARETARRPQEPVLWVVSIAVFAFLSGAAGGTAGWMLSGGHSISYRAFGGTTMGRLACSAIGAFGLSLVGTAAGEPFGMGGVCVAAALTAMVGALLGFFFGYILN